MKAERLQSVIDAIVKRTMRMDLFWDWPCGVAYYGISEAYLATGNREYLDMLKERIDEHIEAGLPSNWTVNACAMGHVLLTIYEHTGEQAYMDIAQSKLDYLQNGATRFGDSVLQHTVSSKNDFPEQAWADTLFMAAFFMLRTGVMLKNENLVNDALNQYYWHIQYLQNRKTGLWYHAYDNLTGGHMSGFFWGRANAWAAYTMSQIWRYMPEWYLYPKCMDVQGSIAEQLSALKLLQTPDGLWRTLLDDADSYEEVSASCGIAAAMLNMNNPLHRKHVAAALEGVFKNISDDGRVLNVSGGTAVMKDREGYKAISRDWIQGWGQGLALAFLSAAYVSETKDDPDSGRY